MSRYHFIGSMLVLAIVPVLAGPGFGRAALEPVCASSSGRSVSVGESNSLSGVSTTSTCDAWAVGAFSNGLSSQTLIEHWDGTRWRHVKSPNPGGRSRADGLRGVVAVTARRAWAVGIYGNGIASQTLIERWNGSAWKVVPSPNPGGVSHSDSLTAVDATSRANVWAVGSFRRQGTIRTLTLHWDGSAWKRVHSPNPGGSDAENLLNGVAVLSPSDVWAVGAHNTLQGQHTLILHWDGSRWTRVKSPNPSENRHSDVLYAVSGSSQSDAWTVGGFYDGTARRALTLHWDGDHWSSVAGPNATNSDSANLFGVATDPANAWAVGYSGCCVYSSLIAEWGGSEWQILPSPHPGNPSGDDVFRGVDVDSSGSGWAVGYYLINEFPDSTTRAFITECC
jgi:hypothetical protein